MLQFGGDYAGQGEYREQTLDIYSAVVEYDLGWGSLVSATSQVEDEGDSGREIGRFFLGGVPSGQYVGNNRETFAEELRFASEFDGPLQTVLGLYYEDSERVAPTDARYSGEPSTNPYGANELFSSTTEYHIEQRAVFGELSYDLTDTLSVTGGMRAFEYERTDQLVQDGESH